MWQEMCGLPAVKFHIDLKLVMLKSYTAMAQNDGTNDPQKSSCLVGKPSNLVSTMNDQRVAMRMAATV